MIELGISLALLAAGFWFGSRNEKTHFNYLKAAEKELSNISVRSDKGQRLEQGEFFLVTGNVVIASDYFKNFVGAIKNFFGGRMTNQENLLQRARREAVIRMQMQAKEKGAAEIRDVHITTSFIDQLGVEVSVYGTAVKAAPK